jgi:uncharacterized lipoprotein YmbA
MTFRSAGLVAALLLGLTACFSPLTSSSPPPSYYQLAYAEDPVECAQPVAAAIRVWPLEEVSPYDRDEMVVARSALEVSFSRQNHWIAAPGRMLSQMLIRDLSQGRMFARVTTALDINPSPYHLGGHLFKFAWEWVGGAHRAVLDAEIFFWREEPHGEVLLNRRYHFESPPMTGNAPELFAQAMSDAARRFSTRLRSDLCATRIDSSSRGDD